MQRGGYGAATSVKRELQHYRGHEKFYFQTPPLTSLATGP